MLILGDEISASVAAYDFDLALTRSTQDQTFHWGKEVPGCQTIGLTSSLHGTRRSVAGITGLTVSPKTSSRAPELWPLLRHRSSPRGDCASAARRSDAGGALVIVADCASCGNHAGNVSPPFITSSMKRVARIRQFRPRATQAVWDVSIRGTQVYTPSAENWQESDGERVAGHSGLFFFFFFFFFLRLSNRIFLATANESPLGKADLRLVAGFAGQRAARTALSAGRWPEGGELRDALRLSGYALSRSNVWIERVLLRKYFPRRRRMTAQQLREFAAKHFGENGGYAQQYLFHHALFSNNSASRLSPAQGGR